MYIFIHVRGWEGTDRQKQKINNIATFLIIWFHNLYQPNVYCILQGLILHLNALLPFQTRDPEVTHYNDINEVTCKSNSFLLL